MEGLKQPAQGKWNDTVSKLMESGEKRKGNDIHGGIETAIGACHNVLTRITMFEPIVV